MYSVSKQTAYLELRWKELKRLGKVSADAQMETAVAPTPTARLWLAKRQRHQRWPVASLHNILLIPATAASQLVKHQRAKECHM